MKFYVDTSVWGGYFDKEFSELTIPFVDQIYQGRFTAVISNVTINELANAPDCVRTLIANIPEDYLEIVAVTPEQEKLAELYVKEGALTKKFISDALHIAMASTLKVDSFS